MNDLGSESYTLATAPTDTRRRKIHCKQELIVSSLQRFYNQRDDVEEILQILQGTSVISLRLIDWFVTNYAKKHSTSYILNQQEFLVYLNYKSQLKAYSKKLFDPFCRRERILFQITTNAPFLTTVGKLNFFRWAIEKGILNYIRLNLPAIEKEMNVFMRETQKQRKGTPTDTQSSQSSSASSATVTTVTTVTTNTNTASTKGSTRRRIANKESSTAKIMQKHDLAVEVRFD
jgi:hypothetical protein